MVENVHWISLDFNWTANPNLIEKKNEREEKKKNTKKNRKLGFWCMFNWSITSCEVLSMLSMFGHSDVRFPRSGNACSRCSHCKFTSVLPKWRTKWNTNSTDYTTVQMNMKLYQLPPPIKGDCTALPKKASYEINLSSMTEMLPCAIGLSYFV